MPVTVTTVGKLYTPTIRNGAEGRRNLNDAYIIIVFDTNIIFLARVSL